MFVAFLAKSTRGHLAMVYPAELIGFEMTPDGATAVNVQTGNFVSSPHDPHRALHLLSAPVQRNTVDDAWTAAHALLKDYENKLTGRAPAQSAPAPTPTPPQLRGQPLI